MRWNCILSVAIFTLAACAESRGIGFDHYEIDPAESVPPEGVEYQWRVSKPIPRYRVNDARTANDAALVLPYAKSPQSSVPAKSDPNIWLRVISAGDRNWLVAESASGAPPVVEALRIEAIQRSGCLVSGVQPLAEATVFLLDCT